jgi:hypothetical protein
VRTLVFRKQSPLSKHVVTQLSKSGNDLPLDNAIRRWLQHIQETDNGLHPKGADLALRIKMLIESRKRFLEAHQNELDELLCG